MKKSSLVLFIFLISIHLNMAQTINPPKGRIAIVADGNSPDPDDFKSSGFTR